MSMSQENGTLQLYTYTYCSDTILYYWSKDGTEMNLFFE